ncbi:MAG TPA: hypothetical protein VMR52_05355 [Dehalococcoidia bacterium]|nr:hypothetical protein [Dehalococcoidia bacterium]
MERAQLVSNLVVGLFGAFTLALGLWAIIDTSSFYENIAEFPPYNRHFLHDVGAFQIGLGAALLLALVWRGDAVLSVLGGAAAGGVAHWIAHVADEGLGGRSSDPYTLGVIALMLVAVFAWRLMAGRPEKSPT